ncbi:MAG: lipoyl(octanoyl) transferase LipB [Bdellovibrionaceae bacterium]|nr:lipoyl(octanoyl) transferase LipB [Pseudobdellovibrionaceae bacterium]
MKKIVEEWLGLVDYNASVEAQNTQIEKVKSGRGPVVLGCEHPAVVTLGRRCEGDAELRSSPAEIESQGIQLVKTQRGGHATLHSPGQLIIYPIISLKEIKLGVKDYMHMLMAVTSDVLAKRGVNTAFVTKTPGLYTDKGKIAFFGIRVQGGVSSHGVSINVSNNLELFKNIRSCGKDSENFDSLISRDVNAQCQELFIEWFAEFEKVYYKLQPREVSKSRETSSLPLTDPR